MRVYEMDEDYAEYLAEQQAANREQDIERFNTPVGKWAPADFEYDPLSKRGFE